MSRPCPSILRRVREAKCRRLHSCVRYWVRALKRECESTISTVVILSEAKNLWITRFFRGLWTLIKHVSPSLNVTVRWFLALTLQPFNASTCIVALLPVNKIGKRPLHFLEHSAGFFLCSVETVLDRSFRALDDARYLSLIVVAFDVLHGGAGKHPLRSHHRASRPADAHMADGTRRSVSESHNPHRFAALVCAQCVIGRCKTGVRRLRRMTRHRVRAAGIQV